MPRGCVRELPAGLRPRHLVDQEARCARVEKGAARAKYTLATEDVKEEIAHVRRAFDVLDTRVLEAYLDDKTTLSHWRGSSRVPAKLGRPRKRKARLKSRYDVRSDDSWSGTSPHKEGVTPREART